MLDSELQGTEVVRLLEQIEEHLAAMRTERMRPPEVWLTVEEVAQELKLSRDTVERLIGSADLRAASIETPRGQGQKSRYRVRREWLDEFMQSKTQPETRRSIGASPRKRRIRADPDFIG